GGARRGANMGILDVSHPDIELFINLKRDQASVLNFNLSVAVTDEFMRAVKNGSSYRGKSASALFDQMAQAAWECGDPGLIYIDEMNRRNPTPHVGRLESTNPCGEQPLLPYESCNLGSI